MSPEEGKEVIIEFNKMKAENEQLKEENEKLKEELLQSDYVKASVLSDREEYKNRIIELTKENKELRSRLDEFLEHDYDNQKLYEEMKRENRELKDKIERLK